MSRGHGSEIVGYLAALTRDPVLADELLIAVITDLANADGLPRARRRTQLYRAAWQAFDRRGRPVAASTATNAVSALRAELDAEEHSILILYLDRGLTFREIAYVMGLDEATIARCFEELRRRLRRLAVSAGLIGA